jgi:hypothetical protein
MMLRTDRHNNPAAFTTAVAKQAGLRLHVDYSVGDAFPDNPKIHTARLLGDPVDLTLRVIDAVGYYTNAGTARWTYIAIPKFVWDTLSPHDRVRVVQFHYAHEGGTLMRIMLQQRVDSTPNV